MTNMLKLRDIDPEKSLLNLDETRAKELKERKIKYFWKELTQENIKKNFNVAKMDERVKVSLSWKKDFKAVVNWMRNHMEAFPETHKGFVVDFIDDKGHRWYRVKLCKEDEIGDVNINWFDYVIKENPLDNSRDLTENEILNNFKVKNKK